MLSPSDMMRQTIGNPDSLFAQVADRIAVAIVSGEVAPGEVVPALDNLGADFSVSRTVYREALKFLSAKGLIEARPRSGTRVCPPASWNLLDPDVLRWSLTGGANEKFIRDLFELRGFIEPNAARLAAVRRTAAQARAIREAFEGMAAHAAYTPENIHYDVLFHEAVIEACGNHAVQCLKSVVVTTLIWSLQLQRGRLREDYDTALGDHRRICESIELQDSERASTVMTMLVQDAYADTLTMFRARRKAMVVPVAAE